MSNAQKTMTIHFKDGRPPLVSIPFSKATKDLYEKNLSKEIKEFKMDGFDEVKYTSTHSGPAKKKVEEKKPESGNVQIAKSPITDEELVKELSKRGKSNMSISKLMGIKPTDVETILNK